MRIVKRNFRIQKRYIIFFVFVLILDYTFGQIKNGYNIIQLNESLTNLKAILKETAQLTVVGRRQIELKVDNLENLICYYELTENLLDQFKTIAPGLFAEIDTIKDRKGRSVRVYVKFVPVSGTQLQAWGATYIYQSATDPDVYCSEYGEYAVSVKIWIVSKALLVLSHELGHVKYQVPNLASYIEYHRKHYARVVDQFDILGHSPDDPSGKTAVHFAKRFRKEYSYFMKISSERISDPLALMNGIRKKSNKNFPTGTSFMPAGRILQNLKTSIFNRAVASARRVTDA